MLLNGTVQEDTRRGRQEGKVAKMTRRLVCVPVGGILELKANTANEGRGFTRVARGTTSGLASFLGKEHTKILSLIMIPVGGGAVQRPK
jgi:hypothetical protein